MKKILSKITLPGCIFSMALMGHHIADKLSNFCKIATECVRVLEFCLYLKWSLNNKK